jgi:hypothetical protein
MTSLNANNKSHPFIISMFMDKETKASKITKLVQGDTDFYYKARI